MLIWTVLKGSKLAFDVSAAIRVGSFPRNTGFRQGSGNNLVFTGTMVFKGICGNKSIIDISTG